MNVLAFSKALALIWPLCFTPFSMYSWKWL